MDERKRNLRLWFGVGGDGPTKQMAETVGELASLLMVATVSWCRHSPAKILRGQARSCGQQNLMKPRFLWSTFKPAHWFGLYEAVEKDSDSTLPTTRPRSVAKPSKTTELLDLHTEESLRLAYRPDHMASSLTPKRRRVLEDSQFPVSTYKTNGITPSKAHLPREDVLDQIFESTKQHPIVVIGSPASTGKTSLLQLVRRKLINEKKDEAHVVKFYMESDKTSEHYKEAMGKYLQVISQREGNADNVSKPMWLLLDDAQNCCDDKFNPFWEFLTKEVEEQVHVIIGATHDLHTKKSPVNFRTYRHIEPDATQEEIEELLNIHMEVLECSDWIQYRETMLKISKYASHPSGEARFHIGVVMAGMRLIAEKADRIRQRPHGLKENDLLNALRKAEYTAQLKRCFPLPDEFPENFKTSLVQAVTEDLEPDDLEDVISLSPFIRAGLLTRSGKFSNIAAQWYYNRTCFPGRAEDKPDSLEVLIVLSVASMSAKRLRDTLSNGFPKEATFQHLFNEALSQNLPILHIVIPELNTAAQGDSGEPITGELDFYVNGSLKWAIELLRNGDKIGEHLQRFHLEKGKYRNVVMNDYIVVDCRGPKSGNQVKVVEGRCTLYFAKDFSTCECQMRLQPELRTIKLKP